MIEWNSDETHIQQRYLEEVFWYTTRMARFSERVGAVTPGKALQIDSISDELQNSLWNLFLELYDDGQERRYWRRVAAHIARYFRKVPADELPLHDHELRRWVKDYFFGLPWHGVYDLTEFFVHNHREMTKIPYGYDGDVRYHRVDQERMTNAVNRILERELSGFRFVQGILVPITTKEEIAEIDAAADSASKLGLLGAREHIRSALDLLGKKPNPDYRNAIKEAISSVESVVKQISKSDSAGLATALKELSAKSEIHGALQGGFAKLYGYTSDESGIRHALLDEPSVGFAEAKYMIVSCSAFVHYLIQKADEAGLLAKKNG
jgi:hypothetical protein